MFLVCSTNPVLGLGGYKHLGLTAKYRANLKQLLKNRWIRGYTVTPYPRIRSTYSALSRILFRSGGVFCCYSNTCREWRATGPSALVFFSSGLSGRFIKTTGSAPPDPDFSQTPWNSFFAPKQYL